MNAEPDWRWNSADGGTYEASGMIDGEWVTTGPIPYDQPLDYNDHNPGVFYVGAAVMPIRSRLARWSVKGVLQQVTPEGNVTAQVHLRRGLFGWPARRWIRKHPLQMNVEMYRPEWGEWRNQTGTVKVSDE